jgi:6-phosphogluconolactonase (cycloisomerase 2 family)
MVADRSGNRVGVFKITGSGASTTLTAVPGSPFASGGVSTHILALNDTGSILFAANATSRTVTTFGVNITSGALTSLSTSAANGASGRFKGMAFAPVRYPTAAHGGLVFALRDNSTANGGNYLYGFRVNELSGAMTPLSGFPLATGGSGNAANFSERLAYDAASARLFVLNAESSTVNIYGVDILAGVLTPLPYSPIHLVASTWSNLHVAPGGSPLIVSSSTGKQLYSLAITSTSATPAAGNPYATTNAPISGAFSQDGANFYTGQGTSFNGFRVNHDSGELTSLAGSPYPSGIPQPSAFVTGPTGGVFMADLSGGGNRGIPTSLAGIPMGGDTYPNSLTAPIHGILHPKGFYMVADQASNRVGVYQVTENGTSTLLTQVSGSPFNTGGQFTDVLALDQSGTFLFAANGASHNISTFAVDPSTGMLRDVNLQPAGTLGSSGQITGLAYAGLPRTVAQPEGFVYALLDVNGGANQLYGYRVDAGSGALTQIPGFPIATGGTGTDRTLSERLAYDATNARLYAINGGSNTISAYTVDRSTGVLTPMSFSPIILDPGLWYCLAVHPSGSPLIVANRTGSALNSFNITPSSASPAPGSPYTTSTANPFVCGISPDGAYTYTGGDIGYDTAGFSVDANTGSLTPIPGSPFTFAGVLGVSSYVFDQTGRLFMGTWSGGQIRVATLTAGVPTVVSTLTTSGLVSSVRGVVHPAGYYMAPDRTNGQIGVFKVIGSGAGTTLSPVSGSPFNTGGDFTAALALDQTGKFLIAANGNSRNLTTFQVDPGTGALDGVSILQANSLGNSGRLNGMVYVPALANVFLPSIEH